MVYPLRRFDYERQGQNRQVTIELNHHRCFLYFMGIISLDISSWISIVSSALGTSSQSEDRTKCIHVVMTGTDMCGNTHKASIVKNTSVELLGFELYSDWPTI